MFGWLALFNFAMNCFLTQRLEQARRCLRRSGIAVPRWNQYAIARIARGTFNFANPMHRELVEETALSTYDL